MSGWEKVEERILFELNEFSLRLTGQLNITQYERERNNKLPLLIPSQQNILTKQQTLKGKMLTNQGFSEIKIASEIT